MRELVVEVMKVFAPASVMLIVFAEGLGISPRPVYNYFTERPGLMLRSLGAALVLVPVAALLIILALKPAADVAIGLAILVSCPPAPLMIKATPKVGGGSAPFMASLHLSLALLAFLTVPLVLSLLSAPLGFNAEVDLAKMAMILAKTILLPIGAGMTVRGLFPSFADRVAPGLAKTGTVGLGVVVLVALVAVFPALLKMDPWSYAVIALVSAAALSIGHLLGPRDPAEKTTLAVECAVRHPALSLSIAAANFSPERALPALVPCVVTFIVVAMIYMLWRRKSLNTQTPAQAPS
jgi:BASS family bile acid:Na+ symporter